MKATCKRGIAVVFAALGFLTLAACQTAFDSMDPADHHVMWFIRTPITQLTVTPPKVPMTDRDWRDLAETNPLIWPAWLYAHGVEFEPQFGLWERAKSKEHVYILH